MLSYLSLAKGAKNPSVITGKESVRLYFRGTNEHGASTNVQLALGLEQGLPTFVVGFKPTLPFRSEIKSTPQQKQKSFFKFVFSLSFPSLDCFVLGLVFRFGFLLLFSLSFH